MFLQTLGEVLGQSSILVTIVFLWLCGWIMERIISRLALMCRSVHVIHVPWGILTITILTYLNGLIDYKAVVAMALFYMVSYPAMWYINYKFSRDLSEILREKQVTHETTGQRIWAEEYQWVRHIKRFFRHLTGRDRLNEEIINWIMDSRGTNGYHVRHYYRSEAIKRDN